MTTPWTRFWQPGLDWLNEANMTNYRSLNAMRIAVAIIFAGIAVFLVSSFMAWRSFWIAGDIHEAQVVSAILLSGKEAASFAKDIFEGMLWFAGAIGGFAVGGTIAKRATDTDHRVKVKMAEAEVEKAKKQPVVMQQTAQQGQQTIKMPEEPANGE